jgi:ankyrin repeat protein
VLSAEDRRALLLSLATAGDVKGLEAVGLKGATRLFGKESFDTPLHRAARAGSMAAVEVLLAAGFDPNFFTAPDGQEPPRSPLTDALAARHGDVARRLAEGGAVAAMPKKTRPDFQSAVDATEVASCIDACAHPLVACDDLETLTWFLARPETQRHVLLLADAIDRDDLDRVRALLDGGVPINDKLGKFVPLDVARELERAAIVELLVARGAASKRKPPRPSGPAQEKRVQEVRDTEEMIHRRLDAGLDPITELDLALRRGGAVAAWFVSHPSVKPDLVLPQMGSPLHGAATLGDAAMLRQLLARGGDPSACAANRGESPKVKLGQTPLHVLSSLSWDQPPLEGLEVLLGAGAAVNALDAAGQTPLDVVGFRAVRARLRAAGALGGREIAEAEA